MRTTVTLEPDVAAKLQAYARRKQFTFKAAINDALRRGLVAQAAAPKRKRFVVKPHDLRFAPGIDQSKLGQLDDELQTLEFIRKMNRK